MASIDVLFISTNGRKKVPQWSSFMGGRTNNECLNASSIRIFRNNIFMYPSPRPGRAVVSKKSISQGNLWLVKSMKLGRCAPGEV